MCFYFKILIKLNVFKYKLLQPDLHLNYTCNILILTRNYKIYSFKVPSILVIKSFVYYVVIFVTVKILRDIFHASTKLRLMLRTTDRAHVYLHD